MLLFFRQIVLDPFALQVRRQGATSARAAFVGPHCYCQRARRKIVILVALPWRLQTRSLSSCTNNRN